VLKDSDVDDDERIEPNDVLSPLPGPEPGLIFIRCAPIVCGTIAPIKGEESITRTALQLLDQTQVQSSIRRAVSYQ
jgi:hypothetical protein